ncbi:MAG: serine hydrolase [Acidobacteriota bacterium]
MTRPLLPALSRCALCLVAGALLTMPSFADSPFDGRWEGQITLPTAALEIDIDFASDPSGALTGDISIPVQSIRDMALSGIETDGDAIEFSIPGIPGDPTFDGALSAEGDVLSGDFTQGGAALTFTLERSAPPADAAQAALDGIEEVIDQAIADFNVPGVGLAVVQGGEVVYAEGFGSRDLESELPMTADSLFAIGSTTKAMTATLLAMQVDEGKLDWDEPLIDAYPSFRLSDPMISARVTPRDLVTHRTGLPRHDLLWYNEDEMTRDEVIERFEHLELTADLRETFQYNNLMFLTAGHLAGRLDDGSWEESMRARLFAPLGMERSNFSVEMSKQDPDHALPYRETDDDTLERIPFRNIDLVGPAGSVNSSVREMSRWLLFNLNGGAVDGEPLIQSASLADLHSPHMTMSRPGPDARVAQRAYGMGWFVEVYRGHRRIQHGGGIDGFITTVQFFPDDDLGIVAFTNRGSGLPGLVAQTVADRMLGLEAVDWIGEALAEMRAGEEEAEEAEAKLEETRVAGTSASHPLGDYAGSYAHPGYGPLEVTLEGDDLSFHYNDITTPLEHWHYDVWNGAEAEDDTFDGTKLLFRGNVDGEISELVIAFDLRASPIVFAKQAPSRLSDPAVLERFTGVYAGATGQRVRVERSGDRLTLQVAGQPVFQLVPQVSGRFALESLQGFSVGFREAEDGSVDTVTFYQPNGVFESTRVDEAESEEDGD